MTAPLLTAIAPEATPPGDDSAARRAPHPLAMALASALLLWLAFPPARSGLLAWVALAPLFSLALSDRPRWLLYTSAWAGGMLFWHLAVLWVCYSDPSAWLGWTTMASYLSLGWIIVLGLCRLGVKRFRLPLIIACPLACLAEEYYRNYAMTGLPWYYLSHTQQPYLAVIQSSDLAGAWGLSFLIALVNAALVQSAAAYMKAPAPSRRFLSRPTLAPFGIALALLGLTLLYGGVRLATASFRPGPRLALLQSNFKQEVKMNVDAATIITEYYRLGRLAAAKQPDLIVWPETSYPRGYPFIHPALDDATLDSQTREINSLYSAAYMRSRLDVVRAELGDWSARIGIPMVVGVTSYVFQPQGLSRFNSALLIQPGVSIPQRYDKLHLVPFGEYVPLLETFPWLTRLTPYHDDFIPRLNHGAEPVTFELNGLRYANAICFEDTLPAVVSLFFRGEQPGFRSPDVILNISNDGWFQGSSELDMHLAISCFRAVEHRVPIARAVNTGISAVIDGSGRVIASLPKLKADALVANVPLDDRQSLYSRFGDWLPQLCAAACAVMLALSLIPKRFLRRRTISL